MDKGDRVIITEDGKTVAQIDSEWVQSHEINRTELAEFQKECYTFKKGDKGIITDLNASGTRWKIKVGKTIKYVPVEAVVLDT